MEIRISTSRLLSVLAFGVMLAMSNVQANVFNFDVTTPAVDGTTYMCTEGEECIVNCVGDNSCEAAHFTAADDYNFTVNCLGRDACHGSQLVGPKRARFYLKTEGIYSNWGGGKVYAENSASLHIDMGHSYAFHYGTINLPRQTFLKFPNLNDDFMYPRFNFLGSAGSHIIYTNLAASADLWNNTVNGKVWCKDTTGTVLNGVAFSEDAFGSCGVDVVTLTNEEMELVGLDGIEGAQGETGAQGVTGDVGATGATGAQGVAGANGANGATGAQGPQGDQGIQGDQGLVGAQGVAGVDGINGATGAQGPQGDQGLVGPQGIQGDQGLVGAQGVAGVDGIDGATGAQGPQGDQGLVGPQGIQGDQGLVGAQGVAGVDGVDGATGAQGPEGVAGIDGATGPQGPLGVAGVDGAIGPQGEIGLPGDDFNGAARLATLEAQVIALLELNQSLMEESDFKVHANECSGNKASDDCQAVISFPLEVNPSEAGDTGTLTIHLTKTHGFPKGQETVTFNVALYSGAGLVNIGGFTVAKDELSGNKEGKEIVIEIGSALPIPVGSDLSSVVVYSPETKGAIHFANVGSEGAAPQLVINQ